MGAARREELLGPLGVPASGEVYTASEVAFKLLQKAAQPALHLGKAQNLLGKLVKPGLWEDRQSWRPGPPGKGQYPVSVFFLPGHRATEQNPGGMALSLFEHYV